MRQNVKKAMSVGMALGVGVTPVMMNVSEVNAEGMERGIAATLGKPYTVTFTASDNGKVKDYDVNIGGSQLVVKLQQMKFQSGEELKWNVRILNSSGKVVKSANATECPLSNNERVMTFTGLSPGKYTVRLDPSLHIYNGSVNVGLSFSSDGSVSDWKNHWAKEAIQEGMDKGWVDKADIFRPDDSMTRAEVVKVINRAYGLEGSVDEQFSDVNPNDWFYNDIKIALANNLISKDTKFRPRDKISRQEFATMISNIETGKKGDSNHDKYKKYQDYNQSGAWARDSIEYTIEKGYMGAGGRVFNPVNNITRAEVITTLSRIK